LVLIKIIQLINCSVSFCTYPLLYLYVIHDVVTVNITWKMFGDDIGHLPLRLWYSKLFCCQLKALL